MAKPGSSWIVRCMFLLSAQLRKMRDGESRRQEHKMFGVASAVSLLRTRQHSSTRCCDRLSLLIGNLIANHGICNLY